MQLGERARPSRFVAPTRALSKRARICEPSLAELDIPVVLPKPARTRLWISEKFPESRIRSLSVRSSWAEGSIETESIEATERAEETISWPELSLSGPMSRAAVARGPEPVLVNGPGPVRELSAALESESKVPPGALTVAVRLRLALAVARRVPPLKVIWLAALPRLAALETARTPR